MKWQIKDNKGKVVSSGWSEDGEMETILKNPGFEPNPDTNYTIKLGDRTMSSFGDEFERSAMACGMTAEEDRVSDYLFKEKAVEALKEGLATGGPVDMSRYRDVVAGGWDDPTRDIMADIEKGWRIFGDYKKAVVRHSDDLPIHIGQRVGNSTVESTRTNPNGTHEMTLQVSDPAERRMMDTAANNWQPIRFPLMPSYSNHSILTPNPKERIKTLDFYPRVFVEDPSGLLTRITGTVKIS